MSSSKGSSPEAESLERAEVVRKNAGCARDRSSEESVRSQRVLRWMAVVRWVLFGLVAAVAAGTWWTLVLRGDAGASGEARFFCPMHPQITSSTPGTCPICFMQLEPIPMGGESHEGHAHSEAESDASDPVVEAPSLETPEQTRGSVMLTTERRQASGISVVPVVRETTHASRRWPAIVEAIAGARSEVRVRTTSFIERVSVRDPGVTVRRGQTLAWVVAPEVARAEEELLAASRWEEPRRSALVEAATRRLALLGVSDTEARAVLTAGHVRSRIALRAPSSGTLVRAEAAVGVTASAETVLYEIADLERVWITATLFAPADVALARQPGASFVPRGGGAPLAIELSLIEPSAEPGSRASRARFVAGNSPENEPERLRLGDVGEVMLDEPEASALLVPRDAVLDRGHAQHVFVETEPGTFSPRVVRAGPLRGDRREILEGLVEGERVVARGGFVLDSEARLAAALRPVAPAPQGER